MTNFDNINLKEFTANTLAFSFGVALVILFLFGTETFLRFKYEDHSKFYYTFDPTLLDHAAIFKRSPVPRKTDAYPRVFCLGGSTTNGCNMPIPFSYPNILQTVFIKNRTPGSAYNFGISGVNSVTTNSFVKDILPQYDPSAVVMHDGYNDLPIVIKKLGDDKYEYIKPDYAKAFNPYIKNPVVRYVASFFKYNFRSIRRFVVTFVKDVLKKGGDLFLGFDYTKYKKYTGSSKDIYEENKKRLAVFLKYEIDTIEYCLAHNIKVVIILEPYIKPYHSDPNYGTGFRDVNVGPILSECHKAQQSVYLKVLLGKYQGNPNVKVIDMRTMFDGKHVELFYDECHLNGKGNAIKAQIIYRAIQELFGLKPIGK